MTENSSEPFKSKLQASSNCRRPMVSLDKGNVEEEHHEGEIESPQKWNT